MRNVNVGLANLMFSEKLKSLYFNGSLNESESISNDLMNVITNSPILQLEFKVMKNIENKHIENDIIACRYIDNNIRLFESFTLEELKTEHSKLIPFLNENVKLDLNKIKLYEAINDLIIESLNDYDDIDVDNIHESFTKVLNHIKTKKETETKNNDIISEEVIEIAINKFNERYVNLDESDNKLIKKLIKSSTEDKLNLLETYKADCLKILNELNENNSDVKLNKTIDKINGMVFDKQNNINEQLTDTIIDLHELKKALI